MDIRSFEDTDWPALWAIIRPILEAGETYPQPPGTSEAEARDWWVDDHEAVFVAEAEGRILGTYYIVANKPGLGGHVCNCGYMVADDARGRGVGRRLGEHSLKEARRRGYRAMQFNLVVASNEPSVRLWRGLGFAIAGRLPEAFAHKRLGYVDAYVMFRPLTPDAASID